MNDPMKRPHPQAHSVVPPQYSALCLPRQLLPGESIEHYLKAIEMTLRRIDVTGIAPHLRDIAEHYTVKNSLDWQLDPSAAKHVSRPTGLMNTRSTLKSTFKSGKSSPCLKHC
ncbi:hypothetical protein ACVIIW_006867 [Bradyrhizobium sp. USDA 4449]